jgi:hypothetical protein
MFVAALSALDICALCCSQGYETGRSLKAILCYKSVTCVGSVSGQVYVLQPVCSRCLVSCAAARGTRMADP